MVYIFFVVYTFFFFCPKITFFIRTNDYFQFFNSQHIRILCIFNTIKVIIKIKVVKKLNKMSPFGLLLPTKNKKKDFKINSIVFSTEYEEFNLE